MLGSRLTPWLFVVGLSACTSNGNRLQGTGPSETTGSGGGSRSATATGSTTSGGRAGSGGSATDGGGGGGGAGGAPASDAALEGAFEMHDDASSVPVPCTNNRATLGSRLRAGGTTPMAFAAAYNAELDSLLGPGPFLMVLLGVNGTTPASWIGAFGALDPGDPGAGARFASGHAEVRFTMGAARSIQIAPADATFDLRFAAQPAAVLVPVASVELSGTLTTECGSLAMTKAKFLVPATAASVAFHGSTVGALMGAPTEALRGQAASAWVLELSGTAKQVYAPGVLDDGGAE
jgi:hypothetical protein